MWAEGKIKPIVRTMMMQKNICRLLIFADNSLCAKNRHESNQEIGTFGKKKNKEPMAYFRALGMSTQKCCFFKMLLLTSYTQVKSSMGRSFFVRRNCRAKMKRSNCRSNLLPVAHKVCLDACRCSFLKQQ